MRYISRAYEAKTKLKTKSVSVFCQTKKRQLRSVICHFLLQDVVAPKGAVV